MTNKPHRATLPKGRGSESAAPSQDTDRTSEQTKKNCPSARQAPGAGLPQWPALGARWQYGGSCSSELWDNKVSRGKLTETTWTRIGLRPNLKGHSTSTDKKQPPRVHSTDPPNFVTKADREHKRIFFQTESFAHKSKASQRKDFFKSLNKVASDEQEGKYVPTGQQCWPNHRRDGSAGLSPEGMTKADTAYPMSQHICSRQERKKNKKREKQRRHRQNIALRENQQRIRERRAHKIRGNTTIFYVPSRRDKRRIRRANRRREYRRFMGKMVSELSKKIGREKLRGNKDKTRDTLFKNSSFVNKVAALQKRQKHNFRIQWHQKKYAFMGTNRRDHITKSKRGDKFVCRQCNKTQVNIRDFDENCQKGSCPPTKAKHHSQHKNHTQRKLHMFENLNAITANIRGINACGKRQILSGKWEKEGIDIALLSEVQKNTGGMEKEGHWGKYTIFFSTGINPKKREEHEQNREKKACEQKQEGDN